MSRSPHHAVSHGYVAVERRHAERVRLVAVLDPADAGLAEVVPAGPGEVADHVRVVGDAAPSAVDRRRVGLGGRRSPGAGRLAVHLEARLPCSCTRDVEVGERLGRSSSSTIGDRIASSMIVAEVRDRGVHAGLLVDVPVASPTSRISSNSSGPATSMPLTAWVTKRVSSRRAPSRPARRPSCTPGRRRPVGDLVADGVEDDARVVDVLAHHRLDVGLPPVGEAQRVVVVALRLRSTCRRSRP